MSIVTTARLAERSFFAAAVRSVLGQTFTDFEWVVLEDPPFGCVQELLAATADPRCRYHQNAAPMPLALARNRAIELARGELVAIFDADDVCAPERLAAQVARFDGEPGLGVLGAAVELIDAHDQCRGFRAYPLGHDAIVRAMRRHNPLAHPTVMLRRQVLASVGGYRDHGEGTCDDYELWSRLAHAGARFANLGRPLLRYRLHGGSMKSRRLRATLRDTLRVKREYWRGQFDLGDRLRLLGEQVLLALPAPLVTGMFLRAHVRRRLPATAGE